MSVPQNKSWLVRTLAGYNHNGYRVPVNPPEPESKAPPPDELRSPAHPSPQAPEANAPRISLGASLLAAIRANRWD